jgi:transcriptional regulator with XRE-family HTH domain
MIVMNNVDVYIQDQFIRMRLTNIRKSRGLTQKQLSEMSGLSTATISNIESGENSYTLRSLIRYAEALGYEINIDKKVVDDNDTEGSDKTISSAST